MSINPILNSVSAALAQQSAPVSVKSSSQTSAATDTSFTPTGTSDSSPASTVLQTASLLSASSNFAQLSSLLEVAQSGTQQISSVLAQLQSLAQSAGSSDDAASVESVFQQVLTQIDQTVNTTTFGGTKLLSGSSTDGSAYNQALDGQGVSLPDLSTQSLFGGQTPSVATSQDAAKAIDLIASGQNTVSDAGSSIESVLGQLSFASASVGTVLANNTAATSTLTDEDLSDTGTSDVFSAILGSPSAAVQAQTGNLSGNLLSLLGE